MRTVRLTKRTDVVASVYTPARERSLAGDEFQVIRGVCCDDATRQRDT